MYKLQITSPYTKVMATSKFRAYLYKTFPFTKIKTQNHPRTIDSADKLKYVRLFFSKKVRWILFALINKGPEFSIHFNMYD